MVSGIKHKIRYIYIIYDKDLITYISRFMYITIYKKDKLSLIVTLFQYCVVSR